MARFSPRGAAAFLRKWAAVGISASLVEDGVRALEYDKRESISRAPKDEGRLARTIRIVKPSSRSRAAWEGALIFRLGAGSRSRDRRKRVEYARVHQEGTVFRSADGKTRAHTIGARAGDYDRDLREAGLMGAPSTFRTTGRMKFKIGGKTLFRRSVRHPGSTFKKRPYIGLNEGRFKAAVDVSLKRSFERTADQSPEFEGLGL